MIKGLVSTIIPVYNRPQMIVEAVKSVIAQTYRPIEIIIIDDGSTDNTKEIAKNLAATYWKEVMYVRQENQGVSSARNTGIKMANGEFIQFLDSDDLLMPRKFEMQVAGLKANPEYGISYCYTREYRLENGKNDRLSRRTDETFSEMFPEILFGRLWGTPSPFYRRDVIDEVGLFNIFSLYEDWEYEGRAAVIKVKLHHCKEVLADIRYHNDNISKEGLTLEKLKDYARVHELIYQYAKQANVEKRYLDKFSRTLFFIARKCAAAGYEEEARRTLNLALEASLKIENKFRIILYLMVSNLLSWGQTGRLCESLDRLKSSLKHDA